MKYVVQYIVVFGILIFSTIAAWYEGSAIRFNSFEWRYSAFFSKMLNGNIHDRADISQLDHFIYAMKFSPAFPILMVCCFAYLLIMSSYLVLRKSPKKLVILHLALGAWYLLLGALTSDSPTVGGTYLTIVLLIIGVVHFILSILFFLKVKKGNKEIAI